MKILFEEIFPEYVHVSGNVVSIPIVDTDEINEIIDKERIKNGRQPLFNNFDGREIDPDGWYEVRLILNKKTCEPIEIEAWAENTEDEDDIVYHMEIEDKEAVRKDIESELKRYGVSYEDLKGIE